MAYSKSDALDIPNLKSIQCYYYFFFLTELVSKDADALATAFRDRSPWCNYTPTLPFTALQDHPTTVESLTIASGTGNTVELEEVDLSPLTSLRSLHIEERCFLFTKRLIVHDLPLLFYCILSTRGWLASVHQELFSACIHPHWKQEL